MFAPSGNQHVLSAGDARAVVTSVGATLRSLQVAGRDVCWGFEESEMSSGGRGQVLAPWPNRIAKGRYEFGGVSAKVPIDEPKLDNAIHGLVRWVPWQIEREDGTSVRCTYELYPQPGYPFRLDLEVRYSLGPEAIVVDSRAENRSPVPAPFGLGFHWYLAPGALGVDGSALQLPASERLVLDEQMLPVRTGPVEGDYTRAVIGAGEVEPLGALRLDDCFSDLAEEDGVWRARYYPDGPSGAVRTVWADAVFGWCMAFTGDTLPEPTRRLGVAVEPMTAPPNAFRTGEGVIVLEPDEVFSASWGIEFPA